MIQGGAKPWQSRGLSGQMQVRIKGGMEGKWDKQQGDDEQDEERALDDEGAGEGAGDEGRQHTVGLEIFDGHKLGGSGVTLGNGFCRRTRGVATDGCDERPR